MFFDFSQLSWIFLSMAILSASFVVAEIPLTAHRGASYDAPENTLAAFKLAWELGADGIEGDFYLTSDGHVVCMHDATTKRTGDRDLRVVDSTLAQLKSVDVGSWKGAQYAGERIPTLQEVLAVVPPGKYIQIEIKSGIEIVEPIARILKKSNLGADQIVLICFNKDVVSAAKKLMPNFKVLWLASFKDKTKASTAAVTLETLRQTGADGLGASATLDIIDSEYIRTVKADGKYEFIVWTVNDATLAAQFLTRGVDAITTDRPDYIRTAFKNLR